MKRQRMAMYGGLLAAAVAAGVTGVAARSNDGEQPGMLRLDSVDRRGGQLGVRVSDVDDPAQPGVRIDGIDADSAAQKAGVKEGDVVVEFDGERVRSARQLTRLVQETPEGRTVKMTVRRGTARQTLDVTPGEGPAAFTWNNRRDEFRFDLRDDVERDIEREIQRGLRERRLDPPAFDFRFDGVPGMPAMGGRGRLGVQVQSLSDQLATYFGVASGGVLVSSVTKESAAEKAGLKAGDVITTVNGTAVRDADALVGELADVKDGAEVSLGIVRDKKATTVKATLEAPQGTRARRSTRPA